MPRKRMKGEQRTTEQLREDYETEKELASRLRGASRSTMKRTGALGTNRNPSYGIHDLGIVPATQGCGILPYQSLRRSEGEVPAVPGQAHHLAGGIVGKTSRWAQNRARVESAGEVAPRNTNCGLEVARESPGAF
jgi:hypothetical protein